MIISKLEYTKKNEIKKSQKCNVKCDKCGKEFKRFYGIIVNSRKKFNDKDLCRSCSSKETILLGLKPTWKKYNKAQKGKTFEERLGKEKAKQTKQKLTLKNKGKNNPMYGKHHSEETRKKISECRTGKTFEEFYGKEKAKQIKQKISKAFSGKNNPMYGKPSPQGSGNGWSGYYKNYYFRSILELSYLIYLLDNNIQFESAEKKEYAIQYEIDNNIHNYFADFYLPDTDQTIEIKPKKLVNSYQNKLKFAAAKQKLGNKHIILTEDNIQKISLEKLYTFYKNKEIIFDKEYDIKFKKYYEERKNIE